MPYVIGAIVIVALLAVVYASRRRGDGRPARHRADVEAPGLLTALWQRQRGGA